MRLMYVNGDGRLFIQLFTSPWRRDYDVRIPIVSDPRNTKRYSGA